MGASLTRDPSDAATVASLSSSFSAKSMSESQSEPSNQDSASTRNHSDSPIEDASPDQSEGEEEEGEGECGFCLFMKAGGCRDSFIAWEDCVEEAEKNNEDIVDKCAQVTAALKKCMEAHSDYYEPILRAEKAAEQQAIIELEKENAKEGASDSDQK